MGYAHSLALELSSWFPKVLSISKGKKDAEIDSLIEENRSLAYKLDYANAEIKRLEELNETFNKNKNDYHMKYRGR